MAWQQDHATAHVMGQLLESELAATEHTILELGSGTGRTRMSAISEQFRIDLTKSKC
jgi:hypothetical protein